METAILTLIISVLFVVLVWILVLWDASRNAKKYFNSERKYPSAEPKEGDILRPYRFIDKHKN